jgi:hypothetical protein
VHALTSVVVVTLLFTLGQATEDIGTGAQPVDWDTTRAHYGCHAKETRPDCAKRLRALLVAELAKPKLTRAMPQLDCRAEERPGCGVTFDGCMPVTGLLVDSLAQLGKDAAVALPEIR